mmetsp:Transcript_30022/g.47937  ORF Transcript_30022/g.47937 Transcript_30022/m.47937 type:complete len:347 (+) Transcript_30022:697-1737(+)
MVLLHDSLHRLLRSSLLLVILTLSNLQRLDQELVILVLFLQHRNLLVLHNQLILHVLQRILQLHDLLIAFHNLIFVLLQRRLHGIALFVRLLLHSFVFLLTLAQLLLRFHILLLERSLALMHLLQFIRQLTRLHLQCTILLLQLLELVVAFMHRRLEARLHVLVDRVHARILVVQLIHILVQVLNLLFQRLDVHVFVGRLLRQMIDLFAQQTFVVLERGYLLFQHLVLLLERIAHVLMTVCVLGQRFQLRFQLCDHLRFVGNVHLKVCLHFLVLNVVLLDDGIQPVVLCQRFRDLLVLLAHHASQLCVHCANVQVLLVELLQHLLLFTQFALTVLLRHLQLLNVLQ